MDQRIKNEIYFLAGSIIPNDDFSPDNFVLESILITSNKY